MHGKKPLLRGLVGEEPHGRGSTSASRISRPRVMEEEDKMEEGRLGCLW